MATKAKKPPKTNFDSFARMMGKAVRLGHEHKEEDRAQATPLELAVNLKVPGEDARNITVLYLREAYLAGYNFVERD